jgi:hypothetical protein
MGIAKASFTFCISDVAPLVLAEELLRCLNKHFLQPKSMEIRLPAQRTGKVEGSIDGDLLWGRDSLPKWLPGERLLDGTGFTILENSSEGLSISRDLSRIMERLKACSEQSAELWKTSQSPDDDVFWTFWGVCHLAQLADNQQLKEVQALRQQLYQAQRLEPILRLVCHLTHHPRPYLMITLLIHSFVWSRYTSAFDAAKQDWVAKSELRAEAENARRLAETISDYVRQYPDVEIEWGKESEHTPDIRGFLPSEFEARLGPPNSPQRINNLATE